MPPVVGTWRLAAIFDILSSVHTVSTNATQGLCPESCIISIYLQVLDAQGPLIFAKARPLVLPFDENYVM